MRLFESEIHDIINDFEALMDAQSEAQDYFDDLLRDIKNTVHFEEGLKIREMINEMGYLIWNLRSPKPEKAAKNLILLAREAERRANNFFRTFSSKNSKKAERYLNELFFLI